MEEVNLLLEPLRAFFMQLSDFLPKLLLATLIVLGAWLLAKAVRFAVARALKAINFHILTARGGIDAFLQQGTTRIDTSGILALMAYWLVILAGLIVAFNSLGLAYVTDLLTRVALFVPRVMFAIVIVALGAYLARSVEAAVAARDRDMGLADAELLGRVARYAVAVFVALIAIDQLDIGGDIVHDSFLIVLAGIVLALALAFGLGGRTWAAALLEHWWPVRDGDTKRGPR